MGFFSKLARKVTHHAKRHWKGWLSGGILDPTVQRHHKSLFKGNWFKSKRVKAGVAKYSTGQDRMLHGSVYTATGASDLAGMNAYQYQGKSIADMMR